jgi:uncharacterized UPF0146 family protein
MAASWPTLALAHRRRSYLYLPGSQECMANHVEDLVNPAKSMIYYMKSMITSVRSMRNHMEIIMKICKKNMESLWEIIT